MSIFDEEPKYFLGKEAEAHAEHALQVLVDIARNDYEPANLRIAAASKILDCCMFGAHPPPVTESAAEPVAGPEGNVQTETTVDAEITPERQAELNAIYEEAMARADASRVQMQERAKRIASGIFFKPLDSEKP